MSAYDDYLEYDEQAVRVELVVGPVEASHMPDGIGEKYGGGAVIRFAGVVREMEKGERLVGLEYEVYEPMTMRELKRLAGEVMMQCGIDEIVVHHSVGLVKVGECSFSLAVASQHRREAIAAVELFIERMKAEVPIWKNPVFSKKGQADG